MRQDADKSSPTAKQALQAAIEDMPRADTSWLDARHTPWSLSREVLRLLDRLVRHLHPQRIVEFGSGLSTACLRRACSEFERECRIVSVDHDPVYQREAMEELHDTSAPTVEFRLAPLIARSPCERFLPMYYFEPELNTACRHADLVLIDGPPEALGGREGILYQVMNFAHPGTLVLLDDADRDSERRALLGWQDNFGDAIQVDVLKGFPKGLAAITVTQPVSMSRLWEHRLRLTVADLVDLGRPEDAIVLIDEGRWSLSSDDIKHPVRSSIRVEDIDQGTPADDRGAVERLHFARRSGARFLVFGWPAFWWLTTYTELRSMLDEQCACVLQNDRLIVYDMQQSPR